MTVRCITDSQKRIICSLYQSKSRSQKALALDLNVSERTIHRVLEEAGLATPVARIKGEAHQVMKLLKEYDMDYTDLKQLLQGDAYL